MQEDVSVLISDSIHACPDIVAHSFLIDLRGDFQAVGEEEWVMTYPS